MKFLDVRELEVMRRCPLLKLRRWRVSLTVYGAPGRRNGNWLLEAGPFMVAHIRPVKEPER